MLVRLAIELPVLLRFSPLINWYLQTFLTEQYNRTILIICFNCICDQAKWILYRFPLNITFLKDICFQTFRIMPDRWFRSFEFNLRWWLWCLTPLSTIFQLYRGGQTGVPEENHRPVASHWQLYRNTPRHDRDSNSQC